MSKKFYDDGLQFECARCSYCCRHEPGYVFLSDNDLDAMVKELAAAGQADKAYTEDEDLCVLLGLFLNSGLSCPMENALNTGSVHLQVVSLIRLWSNGAFQEILRQIALDEKNNERK